MISSREYHAKRLWLLNTPDYIENLEKKYMGFLTEIITKAAPRIAEDFDRAIDLIPFWLPYAPAQRGRSPKGTSIPWLEVGETAIGANIVRMLSLTDENARFWGVPFGADIRFATGEAFIHLDIKVTGPNDRADEVVVPPNQISGDGLIWDNGVANSPFLVKGFRASHEFRPELPPFYVFQEDVLPCLTYFLKAVYKVADPGEQPLAYLELLCVPNGLLLFDGPRYAETPGLLIPGKDDKSVRKKRVRVRMQPLEQINAWRRAQVWSRK